MDEAKDSVTCLCVTDHEILSGSADGRIRRYDLRMGQIQSDFIGSKCSLFCLFPLICFSRLCFSQTSILDKSRKSRFSRTTDDVAKARVLGQVDFRRAS